MTEPGGDGPRPADGTADNVGDPRVQAVLQVIAGEPVDVVAARWAVEPVLLSRWVAAFVEAGTAQVTNRPVGSIARQRDRFLTTFMHDLRTPLALGQMWVGLLRDAPRDPDAVAEIAEALQATLDQLDERALEVELLTAAMLGRLSLDARPVTVAELARNLQPCPEAGHEADTLEVEVDPELFTRVLRDLWDVATTTGTPAQAVRLEVETVDPWTELRVVREGAPIDPTVLHAMFEPFDRADDHERVTVGLYLARALVVVHGGTIGVDQDEQRTTFAVRIPHARVPAVAT
jgi:signal transduction histidine kinase